MAQSVVNNLFDQFSTIKNEAEIVCKFVPHLEISDKVTLSYHSYDIAGSSLYDVAVYDSDDEYSREGDNFDLNDEPYKILAIQTDLNNFKTQFSLREI